MAGIFYAPGVSEITTTTGIGPYALGGAPATSAALVDRVPHGSQVYYRVSDGAQTEITLGIFDALNNTLSRDSIDYPATGEVSWGAGRKIITLEISDDLARYVVVSRIPNISPVASSGDASDITPPPGPRQTWFPARLR